ncbi:N-formylglutamate amidohydrolase [Enterovirga rhinocerotis]|uniref:N-formylglutamate amidohydrolase n=1 Tax=Enterovirga rhinocerotis TaxID=1339210 RepID=A0A4R7C616_9HYPH|nr:N-formylglutamate amidohydrolase [Enterovirga rhinocerotis]TDR94010.1 N-formylglutamate amidohydrolase [Enterovirga rhinocerotis]
MTRFRPDPEFDPPFDVAEPTRQLAPFVFNAPHSGSVYPQALLDASVLDARGLRRSEDAFVDRLFAAVVPLGAPLMSARFPRAYLDVNREELELDPRMFEGRLPARANTRSMRVAGGLGTVPRIVADGHEIYRRRLPVEEALRRIETLYRPYHRALDLLIGRTIERFGQSVLIDCHSMPSGSLGRDEAKAEIVLGDRYGTSCAPALTETVERALQARGFTVIRNKPYAGGFITEHYGAPPIGRHALQIEINRAIYMDERTLTPLPAFADVAGRLTAVCSEVMATLELHPPGLRMAAE